MAALDGAWHLDAHMTTTVLIVDDHASFRASARAVLESEGFAVVGEAATGAEALAAIPDACPEIVLLDVQLPDADGFDLAQRLTANGGKVNVVLVSSRDYSDFAQLIERSGARGFVPKAELSGPRLATLLA
jgi:DNA-binding NarL/FixJ family response regulator